MEGSMNPAELGLSEEDLASLSEEERAELGLTEEAEEYDEEEGPVETDALGRKVKTVKLKTKNTNAGVNQEIAVAIRVALAPSVAAYAGEDFYTSEEELKKAIDADWTRRKANAARPVLRDAESVLDWQAVGQQAADAYKPGRRGGFAPTVELDALRSASSIDDVIKLLQERGVNLQ